MGKASRWFESNLGHLRGVKSKSQLLWYKDSIVGSTPTRSIMKNDQDKTKIRPEIQAVLDRLKQEAERDLALSEKIERRSAEIQAKWDNGWWW